MDKKLLNKTTYGFLAFSVIVLIIAAPVFYFVTHLLYMYETDEVLMFHMGEFIEHDKDRFTEIDIAAWNTYNRNIKILDDKGVTKDSIFSKSYYDEIAGEKEPYRELWAPITINGKNYTYTERINLVEMEGMVFSIGSLFLLVIAALLTGITLISKKLSERIWSPFYNTLSQIQDFEIDKNRQPRFAPTEIEEFNSLNRSIERLIEKNTAIYKGQKEFVENAAHELQTPLALFQTKIDTLSQSFNLSREQSQLIGSLNNDVSRLNRLNKNLLLLSKIDNDSYLQKQPVVLNDYLNKNLDFFIEQGKPKGLTVVAKFTEITVINSNPALAEILINNLFLNAIRHNIKDGRILIVTGHNTIAFYNTGQETPLHAEKIFNRFSKADSSAKGNGLGLAIVKKIVELNNWGITYNFAENLHCFTVTF